MIEFRGRAVVLDIEGTTSSIQFVHKVLFPFARRELESHLHANWFEADFQPIKELIARDAGAEDFAAWRGGEADDDQLMGRMLDQLNELMDRDAKATGLKALQGRIWQSGYASGELKSHVYDDVPDALRRWRAAGLSLYIFSSGSIQAQKLFFGHTAQGDLLNLFDGHFDTTTGPKKEAQTYRIIAKEIGAAEGEVLFLSDVPDELRAAREAGMNVGLLIRPGNTPVEEGNKFERIHDFGEVEIRAGG